MTTLERRYRLLLHAYPRPYRARRGEEILGTLLDAAAPDQQRPSRADLTDLLSGGVRERLGLHAVPGLAAGLRLAGPIALTLTAGLAAGSWLAGARHPLGTVVAAVWLIAVLARVVLRRSGAAPTVVAWLVTIVAGAVSDGFLLLQGFQGEWFLAPVLFGAAAVAGTFHSPPVAERAGLAVGFAALAALSIVGPTGPGPWWAPFFPPDPDVTFALPGWALHAWVVPLGLAVAGVVLAAGRHDTRGLWAALVLLVPMPLLVPPPYLPWTPQAGPDRMTPELPTLVLALVLAFAVNLAVHPREALARCGRLCLASAGAFAAFVLAVSVDDYGTVDGNAAPIDPDHVGLALVVVASLGSRWLLPVQTRIALVAGLTAFLAGAVIRTDAGDGFIGGRFGGELIVVALLVIVALAAWSRAARGSAALTAGAFGVIVALAYGYAYSRADALILNLPFVPDCPSVASAEENTTIILDCGYTTWAAVVVSPVATAVLAPTLVCAAVALLRTGRPGPTVAFIVSFVWCLVALGPQLSSLGYAMVAAGGAVLLGAVRALRLRWRRGPSDNATGFA